MTRYIIQAAGDATRWDNYLNVPKHYAVLDGEPILDRTIRLLKKYGATDIIVASQDYQIAGVRNFRPNRKMKRLYSDAAKFIDTSGLWDTKDRTVLVYGDVYFTDDAIRQIVEYDGRDWRNFCRPWASQHTGTQWGECFAISFYPDSHAKGLNELYRIARLQYNKTISRCGGWEWTRAMNGQPDDKIRHPHKHDLPEYYIIDDLTDDIDQPEDYHNLANAIAKLKGTTDANQNS